MDHADVQQWLDRYIQAWMTYDPQTISDLFSEKAVYKYSPYEKGLIGRDAILADWLKNPDPVGSFKAQYHPVLVEGNTTIANGRSTYFKADGKTIEREFDNIFLIQFDDQGRCLEFTEWFMQKPKE
jgi:hypothetical protein